LERKSMSVADRIKAEVEERQRMQQEMQAEVDTLKSELLAARQAALDGRGLEAEMQRQLEERMAKEREKRVEHTKMMAVRRITKRDLARGWVAWLDLYLDNRRRQNLLQQAGNKLGRPKLSASFVAWQKDWEADEVRKMKKESMSVEDRLREQLFQAKEEISSMKMSLQQGDSAQEDAAREMQEKMAAEKEKRIAHTQEMAVRRIGKRELTRGWSGWLGAYQEEKRIQRTLQKSIAKLTHPKLVATFQHWHADWNEEEKRKERVMSNTKYGRAAREASQAKTELEEARAELAALRLAVREGRGTELEAQRQLEAQLEAERELRVEHTREMAVRRLLKRDLARGWVAWHGAWETTRRLERLLRQTGSTLLRPQLVGAVKHWRADWEAAEATKREAALAEQMEAFKREQERANRDLRMARSDLDSARRAAADDKGAEAERELLLEERYEKEREKRIQHVSEMAMRRMAKRDLVLGWNAWLEPYLERRRMIRQLQQAASRMLKPKLARSFQFWYRTAAAAKASLSNKSMSERLLTSERDRAELEAKLAKVMRQLDDQRTLDEVALGDARGSVANLHKREQELLDMIAAEKKKAIMANSQTELANEQVQQREAKIKHAQEQLAAQQKQAKDHLETQLAESRKALETELKFAQKTIAKLQEELAKLQAERLREKQLPASNMRIASPVTTPSPAPERAGSAKTKRGSTIFGKIDFDEERPLGEQLKAALSKQAIRVLDLFRDWDTNGDGQVSKKEFRNAMPALGMDLPIDVVDALFDQYDLDGQGSIEFNELKKMLSGTPATKRGSTVTQKRLSTAVKEKPAAASNKWVATIDGAKEAAKK